MYGIFLGLHVLICAALIVVVLLQSGKGGGLAGAFGGSGGVGAVFGGQSAATFLTKATRYLAIVFMVSSLTLAMLSRGRAGSGTVTEALRQREATPASATGDAVQPEEIPQDLPGGEGDERPVLPETPEAGEAGNGE